MSSTVTSESPRKATPQYDDFLDDPFNMAMYVVLPAMIIVYGGCCVIYCAAKLQRYLRRRNRRRAKRELLQKDGVQVDSDDTDNNNHLRVSHKGKTPPHVQEEPSISVIDLTDTPRSAAEAAASAATEKLAVRSNPRSLRTKRTSSTPRPPPKPFVCGIVHQRATRPGVDQRHKDAVTTTIVSSESGISQGMGPGYSEKRYNVDVQQQMQHLDDQLKAAFKLITSDPKNKAKSRPDVCAQNNENAKPIVRRAGGAAAKMHFYCSDP